MRTLGLAVGICATLSAVPLQAVTTVFFTANQTATVVATNVTSTTTSSSGYLFACSLDNWWSPTGGGGTPTGRPLSVVWPNGVQAQTLTAGPTGPLLTQVSASITLKRADGLPFDLTTFTGKILGNTAGAGAAFEIMPQLNGQDGLADPLTYDATGYAGTRFTYSPMLTGYDTYIISLWMDFALTSLTLADASLPPPAIQISLTPSNRVQVSWPTNAAGFVLQQNPRLGTTNWTTSTAAVSIVGTNCQANIQETNGTSFFRLQK